MPPHDRDELKALLSELVECSKQTQREDDPAPAHHFREGVDLTNKILGIAAVIVLTLGFAFMLKGDVKTNSESIAAVRQQMESHEKRIHDLEIDGARHFPK